LCRAYGYIVSIVWFRIEVISHVIHCVIKQCFNVKREYCLNFSSLRCRWQGTLCSAISRHLARLQTLVFVFRWFPRIPNTPTMPRKSIVHRCTSHHSSEYWYCDSVRPSDTNNAFQGTIAWSPPLRRPSLHPRRRTTATVVKRHSFSSLAVWTRSPSPSQEVPFYRTPL